MKLQGKRVVKLVMDAKGSPLRFHDRLVYSFLVYRSRIGKGATKKEIAQAIGINHRTVCKALEVISSHGLVQKEGLHWSALKPKGEAAKLFRYHEKAGTWQGCIKTIPLYLPSPGSPVSLRAHAILSVLMMKEKRYGVAGISHAYLARALGMTEACVGTHIRALVANRAILVDPRDSRRYDVLILDPSDFIDWFADRPANSQLEPKGKPGLLSMLCGERPLRWCDLGIGDDPVDEPVEPAREDVPGTTSPYPNLQFTRRAAAVSARIEVPGESAIHRCVGNRPNCNPERLCFGCRDRQRQLELLRD
jgi:hypothetical protein